MKTRTVKFLGVLTLVLAGISVYLFAQNAGNASAPSGKEAAKEKARALMEEIRSLENRYCASAEDEEYFDCRDCIYIWARSYEAYDENTKAQKIERHIEKMQRENRSFSDQLLLLKRWLLWPQSIPIEESFPIKMQQPAIKDIILRNLERRQWKRALVQQGEYNIPALNSFLLEGKLTADGCVDVLKELYNEASHEPKKFAEIDEIYQRSKLELLQEMAKEINKQIRGVKIADISISAGFTVVTYRGQEPVRDPGAFNIMQQCGRILELGR